MRAYQDATLKIINEITFTGEKGEEVKYNELYFQTEDEEGKTSVLKINTKSDIKSQLDKEGVVEIEVDTSGRNKPRFISFKS